MSTTSPTLGDYCCALVCLLAVGAVVSRILLTGSSRRRSRVARAANSWQALSAAVRAHPGAHLCRVGYIYQRANRGTKAVIVWAETGRRQDAWFWYFWPSPGSTLLVNGAVGFGPHNQNPDVFYVDHDGVLAAAPSGAQAAWRRRRPAPPRPG